MYCFPVECCIESTSISLGYLTPPYSSMEAFFLERNSLGFILLGNGMMYSISMYLQQLCSNQQFVVSGLIVFSDFWYFDLKNLQPLK